MLRWIKHRLPSLQDRHVWNYRAVLVDMVYDDEFQKITFLDPQDFCVMLYEVHYTILKGVWPRRNQFVVDSWSKDPVPPMGLDIEDLRGYLSLMTKATQQPILRLSALYQQSDMFHHLFSS